jgi:hypothetical protein
MTAFCKGSLRYINLGQFSFIAADLEAREAVGVLPESLCEDEIGFSTVFLASLLHLSAPALGLTCDLCGVRFERSKRASSLRAVS